RARSPRPGVDVDEVHASARLQEGRQMVDDVLLASAVVGEDVAHEHDVERARFEARGGGAPDLAAHVVEAHRGGQSLGRGQRLWVLVHRPYLAARSNEPSSKG